MTHPLDHVITLLSKLPGLGPRSARRTVLHLLKNRETALSPLLLALKEIEHKIHTCSTCRNLDIYDPCAICADGKRNPGLICVVEDVADLWALERARIHKGFYHVLGGTLSAIDGVGPDNLGIPLLLERIKTQPVQELLIATNATLEGQTTAHYISERVLTFSPIRITRLAQGIPLGGELDYLDDGTLSAAFTARKDMKEDV